MYPQELNTLYQTCPKCHGLGKYQEYDNLKASTLFDHYLHVNYTDESDAWSTAVKETSYVKECPDCHAYGSVLSSEGKRIYQFLKKYA